MGLPQGDIYGVLTASKGAGNIKKREKKKRDHKKKKLGVRKKHHRKEEGARGGLPHRGGPLRDSIHA